MAKKSFLLTILSLMVATCFSLFLLIPSEKTYADSVSVSGQTDTFVYTDKSYTATESFTFTADINFNEGQAGGIVFGAKEGEYAYVFNFDRFENKVKLMYFAFDGENFNPTELYTAYFIGNEKVTPTELGLINPKVRELKKVNLKVILTVENDGAYATFYADNMRRFDVDKAIPLKDYQGGNLGYNCFNANIYFNEIYVGETDYSYYTEPYRQQFHYSQYQGWNNDPNGLVYYKGYYHLYYQHHPYSNYWSDMYWGHARSTDLIHWELLPICLFPDADWRGSNAWMWSGSAMVYHKGMSETIDQKGWFTGEDGLLGFYTRDGAFQDQIIMTSNDGGLTWDKREIIPQQLVGYNDKVDCRDPKVFPVEKSGDTVTLWGMALTSMGTGNIWFLKSNDLVNWSYAGGFKGYQIDVNRDFRAECPDVVTLTADDGTTHTVITLTARNYLVGEITYDANSGHIKFIDVNGNDISQLDLEEIPYQKMDYGPDSYATQSFFIDDTTSEYYGKVVSVSWFSGVPGGAASIESGSLSALRKVWNGGGVTIPVIYGLKKVENGYMLTETPITNNNDKFDKTEIFDREDFTLTKEDGNLLENVYGKRIELKTSIDNTNQADIVIKVGVSENEYTEIGWNKTEGYYVDRRNTSDGGMNIPAYYERYTTGATTGTKQTFNILVDDGSVEVFCEDGTLPFYVLTFMSPYSTGLEFSVSDSVNVEYLTINEIGTIWRDDVSSTETVLYVDKESIELDVNLRNEENIVAYSTSNLDIEYSIIEGEDVISLTKTETGVKVTALSGGTAKINVVSGNESKTVDVIVYTGSVDFDLTFSKEGILSGKWIMTSNGLIGSSSSGDGFILTNESASDFNLSVRFDLGTGTAAAILFRANNDMSSYYVATYDNNEKIIKLWSPYGVLKSQGVSVNNIADIVLSVNTEGNNIQIFLNGTKYIDYVDNNENAAIEGKFGLNVFNTKATFKEVSLFVSESIYSNGNLTLVGGVSQAIKEVINVTNGNVKINKDFYKVDGKKIIIDERYFTTLTHTGEYVFKVKGMMTEFEFSVTINALPTVTLSDITLQEGENANFFIGSYNVTSVKVNGKEIESYTVKDYLLTIDKSNFIVGENTVTISDDLSVTVTVEEIQDETIKTEDKKGCNGEIAEVAILMALIVSSLMLIKIKKEKNGSNN